MGLWSDILSFFGGSSWGANEGRNEPTNELLADLPTKKELPMSGGRSSQPSDFSVLGAIMGAGLQIQNDVTRSQYGAIERVVRTKPDPSQAANNIVLLAGQKVEVVFPATMSKQKQKQATAFLNELRSNLYNGGENSLVSDLLFQLATYGALSAEMVLSNRGVQCVVKVNPKNVRSVWNENTNEWEWYQVEGFITLKSTSDINGLKLNKHTYKYIPLVAATEKPYGLPPFLAALEDIAISEELFCGLKDVIKKMGLLGFLEVLVDIPEREMGEEFNTYQTRLSNYLSSNIAPEVQKSLNNGFVIGFKDSHEFKLHDTVSNITGFEKVFELIASKVHSGLKQNPMLLGKNMTTTESLASVILSVMSSQINTYQRCVSNFLESVYLMHLRLNGFVVDSLQVKIAAPVLKDELKTEQTAKEKIANVRAKLEMGVIDLQQAANELGYEKAATETPPPITGQTAANYYSHTCETCNSKVRTSENYGIAETQKFVESYYKKVSDKYEKTTKKVTNLIGQKLSNLAQNATINDVVSVVLTTLSDSFGVMFTDSITDIIATQIESMYRNFRKDKTPFRAMANVPAATFETRDFRTMDFWKGFDSFYFGKFITDQDTQDRLTQWLTNRYANDALPIGKNKEAITAFRNEFPNAIIAEDWKIRRIIDTSVSKLRNTASVNYMKQARIANYEIVGIGDQLQCPHCAALQGKKFSVEKTVELTEKMIGANPEETPNIMPFAVSITPENLKKYSGDALIGAGIANPPFHPHCRDTVVISLD